MADTHRTLWMALATIALALSLVLPVSCEKKTDRGAPSLAPKPQRPTATTAGAAGGAMAANPRPERTGPRPGTRPAVAIVAVRSVLDSDDGGAQTPVATTVPGGAVQGPVGREAGAGEARIADAFAEERTGIVVEAAGIVTKTLPDDFEGSPHQRFIVRLGSDQTVLIAHNIDLAPRAPVRKGDRIRFRGQYEWNDRGGVVHWTHHDPDGRRPGGWLEHDGRKYR